MFTIIFCSFSGQHVKCKICHINGKKDWSKNLRFARRYRRSKAQDGNDNIRLPDDGGLEESPTDSTGIDC